MARVNVSEIFFLEITYSIYRLYGKPVMGSRISGSRMLKMLRKNFYRTSNGKKLLFGVHFEKSTFFS